MHCIRVYCPASSWQYTPIVVSRSSVALFFDYGGWQARCSRVTVSLPMTAAFQTEQLLIVFLDVCSFYGRFHLHLFPSFYRSCIFSAPAKARRVRSLHRPIPLLSETLEHRCIEKKTHADHSNTSYIQKMYTYRING